MNKYQLLYDLIALHGWKADRKQNPPSVLLTKFVKESKRAIIIDFDNKKVLYVGTDILHLNSSDIKAIYLHGFTFEKPMSREYRSIGNYKDI